MLLCEKVRAVERNDCIQGEEALHCLPRVAWESFHREGVPGAHAGVTGVVDFGELVPGGNGTSLLYALLTVQQMPGTPHSSGCVDLQLTDGRRRSPFVVDFAPGTGNWWRLQTATVGGGLGPAGPAVNANLAYDISRAGSWSVHCSSGASWYARLAATFTTSRWRRKSWGQITAHAVFQVPDEFPAVLLTARAWATRTGTGMRAAATLSRRVALPRRVP